MKKMIQFIVMKKILIITGILLVSFVVAATAMTGDEAVKPDDTGIEVFVQPRESIEIIDPNLLPIEDLPVYNILPIYIVPEDPMGAIAIPVPELIPVPITLIEPVESIMIPSE